MRFFWVIFNFDEGSPLGLFLSLRKEYFNQYKQLLKNTNLYHIYHICDPVAYRIDTLVDEKNENLQPLNISKKSNSIFDLFSNTKKEEEIVYEGIDHYIDSNLFFGSLIATINAHTCYWDEVDVSHFIIKKIYNFNKIL
jgi:hypothetical protein